MSGLIVRPSDLARHRQAHAVADHGADDARLDQLAAVGDGADRRRHLQRRHADLIAHRHRRQRAVGQLRRIPDDAGLSPRKVRASVGRPKPKRLT